MVKQLDHEAREGACPPTRYTLLHSNRARPELAYHDELRAIEAAKTLDFVYVPSTSRPTPWEVAEDAGEGRANNLLRHVFEMPLKEEEDLEQAASLGGEVAEAERALERAVMPRLPDHVTREGLRKRLDPGRTVVLTCGNPQAMSDIRVIAERNGMRFEKEDWKVTTRAPDVVAG
jgi:ferredoxin-NADP reductase